MNWNPNGFEQFLYEKGLVKELLKQSKTDETTQQRQNHIEFVEEQNNTFSVDYTIAEIGKKMGICVKVHKEKDIYFEGNFMSKSFNTPTNKINGTVTLSKPSIPGFYDVVLYNDGRTLAEDKNVSFGEVKTTQFLKIFSSSTEREDSMKDIVFNDGIIIQFNEERSHKGDVVCIYSETDTKNEKFIQKIDLIENTRCFVVHLKQKGRYALKYFRNLTTSPISTTPYIHFQTFSY
ncbi:GOLD domain-containing protein [Entamoeba marina]